LEHDALNQLNLALLLPSEPHSFHQPTLKTMNIKTTLPLIAICLSAAFSAQAQKNTHKPNPKHVNYYRAVNDVVTDAVVLDIKDAVSKIEYMKFRVKFSNKTPDFVRIAAGESEFIIDGKTHKPKDRVFFLDPFDSSSKTLQVDGAGTDFHVDRLDVKFNGFSRIPAKGQVIDAEGFLLPAAKNSITAGDFDVNMKNLVKETKRTYVAFEVTYNGTDYGIVDQSKISVRTEDGQVFASVQSKEKVRVLGPGDKTTLRATFMIQAHIVDMQFANLTVLWNDCFQVSKATPFDVPGVSFEIDPGLTAGKNK